MARHSAPFMRAQTPIYCAVPSLRVVVRGVQGCRVGNGAQTPSRSVLLIIHSVLLHVMNVWGFSEEAA